MGRYSPALHGIKDKLCAGEDYGGAETRIERNDLRSQSLDLLRFPLAFVVLIIHVFNTRGFALRGSQVSVEDMPVLLEINHIIDGFLRGQSVPIYFFISGFVFFLGVELTRGVYTRKLKNRVHTLLIPYIIWNIIDVLLVLARHLPILSSVFPNIHNMPLDFSLSAIMDTFWDSPRGIFALQAADNGAPLFPQDKPLWFFERLDDSGVVYASYILDAEAHTPLLCMDVGYPVVCP